MPALHLQIGSSVTHHCLALVFLAALFLALALCLWRGEPAAAAVVLGAIAALSCNALHVRQGRSKLPREIEQDGNGNWSAHFPVGRVRLRPRGAPTLLPWLVYIPFTLVPGRERCDVWVFRDAVSAQQWRSLRVRLNVCWRRGRT